MQGQKQSPFSKAVEYFFNNGPDRPPTAWKVPPSKIGDILYNGCDSEVQFFSSHYHFSLHSLEPNSLIMRPCSEAELLLVPISLKKRKLICHVSQTDLICHVSETNFNLPCVTNEFNLPSVTIKFQSAMCHIGTGCNQQKRFKWHQKNLTIRFGCTVLLCGYSSQMLEIVTKYKSVSRWCRFQNEQISVVLAACCFCRLSNWPRLCKGRFQLRCSSPIALRIRQRGRGRCRGCTSNAHKTELILLLNRNTL
jgi:hypothetical protein